MRKKGNIVVPFYYFLNFFFNNPVHVKLIVDLKI